MVAVLVYSPTDIEAVGGIAVLVIVIGVLGDGEICLVIPAVVAVADEFGRIDGKPLLASSDHFFYLGVFITLGKKAAYDVSNF